MFMSQTPSFSILSDRGEWHVLICVCERFPAHDVGDYLGGPLKLGVGFSMTRRGVGWHWRPWRGGPWTNLGDSGGCFAS